MFEFGISNFRLSQLSLGNGCHTPTHSFETNEIPDRCPAIVKECSACSEKVNYSDLATRCKLASAGCLKTCYYYFETFVAFISTFVFFP